MWPGLINSVRHLWHRSQKTDENMERAMYCLPLPSLRPLNKGQEHTGNSTTSVLLDMQAYLKLRDCGRSIKSIKGHGVKSTWAYKISCLFCGWKSSPASFRHNINLLWIIDSVCWPWVTTFQKISLVKDSDHLRITVDPLAPLSHYPSKAKVSSPWIILLEIRSYINLIFIGEHS